MILISIFSVFLIINFIAICLSDKDGNNRSCECNCNNVTGECGIILIVFLIVLIIFFLIFLLFKYLSSKGRIIFFHIFSGLISVTFNIFFKEK